jgi:hypothetical protein
MVRLILSAVLLFSLQSCHSQNKDSLDMNKKPVEQVLKDHQDELLSIEGVEGFYQGMDEDGNTTIVLMTVDLNENLLKAVPDSLEGYPVHLEAGGKIRPLKEIREEKLPEK